MAEGRKIPVRVLLRKFEESNRELERLLEGKQHLSEEQSRKLKESNQAFLRLLQDLAANLPAETLNLPREDWKGKMTRKEYVFRMGIAVAEDMCREYKRLLKANLEGTPEWDRFFEKMRERNEELSKEKGKA